MPFTPSHIAAALPFRATPLLPAAVVMGTMAPDIPYFVPLFVPRVLSHSLLGLVTIDLVLGVAAALVWWFLLREPMVDLLPRQIGERIARVGSTDWRPPGWRWPLTVLVLLLSVLVGAATHVLWDSFTHPGWVVDHVAVLRTPLGPRLLEGWLQYASSLGGLIVVVVWSILHLRRAPRDLSRPTRLGPRRRVVAWIAILGAGLVFASAIWFGGLARGVGPFDPNLVFLTVRVGIGVACAALVVIVALWWIACRLSRRPPAS
jgi:hypothetical protein